MRGNEHQYSKVMSRLILIVKYFWNREFMIVGTWIDTGLRDSYGVGHLLQIDIYHSIKTLD